MSDLKTLTPQQDMPLPLTRELDLTLKLYPAATPPTHDRDLLVWGENRVRPGPGSTPYCTIGFYDLALKQFVAWNGDELDELPGATYWTDAPQQLAAPAA